MVYNDENPKHRLGITMPTEGYKCPNCGGKIPIKASLIVCENCKKVVSTK